MLSVRLVRMSLWATCPFNFVAGYAFAFPASPVGQLVGLPIEVPPIYAGATSFLVCVFGGAYGWMAIQPEINRPMLWLGAIGKSGIFFLAACLWLADAAPGPIVLTASADLAFGALWILWLVTAHPD